MQRFLFQKKRDKRNPTGGRGGAKIIYSDWQEVVLDILGRDSPAVEGLGEPESYDDRAASRDNPPTPNLVLVVMALTTDTASRLNPLSPNALLVPTVLNTDVFMGYCATSEQSSTSATTPIPNAPPRKRRTLASRCQSRNGTEEADVEDLKRLKLQLQVEQLRLQNYKLRIELWDMEQTFELPHQFNIEY